MVTLVVVKFMFAAMKLELLSKMLQKSANSAGQKLVSTVVEKMRYFVTVSKRVLAGGAWSDLGPMLQ